MKKNYQIVGFLLGMILFFISIQVKGEPLIEEKNYDICELYMDSKPIINYDMMFGDVIKASSFLVKDRKQPCVDYSFSYDEKGRVIKKELSHLYSGLQVVRNYNYFENGLICDVTEHREDFKKKISFMYNEDSKIIEVREAVLKGANEPLFQQYDYLRYKIDINGNIIEVRGVKEKMLGLSSEMALLKAYDYDERNRLKAVRDFMNPEGTQIFSYSDYVNK